MTSYEKIFNCFLRKISDRELARQIEFDTEYAQEEMIGYLHSAITKIGYLECNGITFNDSLMEIEEDLTDLEVEIYALGMVVEWLNPLVMRRTNIAQMFTGKETQYYSQQQHLTVINQLLQECKVEIIKLKRNFDYQHNGYIEA